MPHLSPLSWLLTPLLLAFFMLLLLSNYWWLTSNHSIISEKTTLPSHDKNYFYSWKW